MATPVCILKRTMPESEFQQWMLYHRDFPLDDQSNHHLPVAQLSALMFNLNRGKNTPTRSTQDFMRFHRAPEPDDGEEGVGMDELMGDGW